jgi:hypothetical protein
LPKPFTTVRKGDPVKKTIHKKMLLSKETLGKLDPKALAQAEGGQINTGGCVLSVNICSNHETCSTCNPETQPGTISIIRA